MITILAHKMPLGKTWSFGFGKGDRVYEANEVQYIPFTLLDWRASMVQTVGMK